MYNQKCNEMSDSCHERLEKGLFIIITTQIVYKCSFSSAKKPTIRVIIHKLFITKLHCHKTFDY